jgi:hypothetical protein
LLLRRQALSADSLINRKLLKKKYKENGIDNEIPEVDWGETARKRFPCGRKAYLIAAQIRIAENE